MTTRADCLARDAAHPLTPLRDQFDLPEGVIYLDGNSLGALPRATAARVAEVVQAEWGQGLIRSWNDAGWIDLPRRIGDRIARLVGAGPDELVVADSTSVNLYKVLAAALKIVAADRPAGQPADEVRRRVILSERSNFPTDLYIAQSLAAQHGCVLELADADAIAARLKDAAETGRGDLALLLLTQVNYRTGRLHDMAALTAAAHAAGALAVWDLAHSAGALPVDLTGADADFAVGCGYKYLNGGPGAPAFAWVHPRHAERFEQPLAGWMGHASPFTFDPGYRPAPGVGRYLCGTPAVLAMAALDCGVATLLAAEPLGGLAALRTRSIELSTLFIERAAARLADHPLTLATPIDATQRGSQVSLACPIGGELNGHAVMQALIARGVIGDFRAGERAGDRSVGEPDLLRFGFTPLYTRSVDVYDAVEALGEVLDRGEWREARFQRRSAVT